MSKILAGVIAGVVTATGMRRRNCFSFNIITIYAVLNII